MARIKECKKIRTAMVGLGKIAWTYDEDPVVAESDDFPTHLRVLSAHPGFELVSAQDVSVEARSAFAKKIKKLGLEVAVYEDWVEMVKKSSVELLVVASNIESHVDICSKAMDLGVKKILCEKPLSYSLKDAETLVKKAERNKCALYVNYPRAFNPSYIELCKNIKGGKWGRVQGFDFKYSKGIFNNGTHALDLLLRMFGEIKRVQGFKNPTCDIKKVDPTVSAVIEFKNGVAGYLYGLNRDFYGAFELEVFCEKGRIKMAGDKNPEGLIDTKKGLYYAYDNIYAGINRCSGVDSLKYLKLGEKIVKTIKK